MPQNKRESLIFTIMMCAVMVYTMSVYNIALHEKLSWNTFKIAWIGFPLAYIIGLVCDWFIVSKIAKKIAFSIIKPADNTIKKTVIVSFFMVCGMVIMMSLYGAFENVGFSTMIFATWFKNIPMNFIIALPFQLLIAGPLVRFAFRKTFPEGKILA